MFWVFSHFFRREIFYLIKSSYIVFQKYSLQVRDTQKFLLELKSHQNIMLKQNFLHILLKYKD